MLPALQSAKQAGVITVPYRVNPGGADGKDYDVWVGADFVTDGKNWANWLTKTLPDGGNILFLSGPAGNSQGMDELKGMKEVLDPGKYTFIGQAPFEVTNWDPAKTQQVLSAAIAKYPKIDAIVSDFGPSLVGALPEFEKSGRSIPALATSDGNVLSCFYEDTQGHRTRTSSSSPSRPATTTPGWPSSGRSPSRPGHAALVEAVPGTGFRGLGALQPNPVTCKKDLPGDIYLSAQMTGTDQATLLK